MYLGQNLSLFFISTADYITSSTGTNIVSDSNDDNTTHDTPDPEAHLTIELRAHKFFQHFQGTCNILIIGDRVRVRRCIIDFGKE